MAARATSTSQDLVPKGLPYGSRQDTVSRMQAAEVPLTSESGGGGLPLASSPAAPPAAVAPAAPISRAELQNFDVFQNRQPTPGFRATSQRQVLLERIRQSGNQVMQSIASRMAGYKEG